MAAGNNIGKAIAKHKVPIIIGCAAVVVIIAAIIILVNLPKYQTIDAQKLFKVKFDGLNGKGTAVGYLNCLQCDPDPYGQELDKDGNVIEKEYSNYFSSEKKDLLKAFDVTDDKDVAIEMRDALLAKTKGEYDLKLELSKSTELSNGDKVTCKVQYDEEELKEAKIKLENTEFEAEVFGLVDAEEIDFFTGFEPSFSGMEESGECTYEEKNPTYPFISYYISEGSSHNLKNGDNVTFTADIHFSSVENATYLDTEDYDPSKGIYFKYNDKTYIIYKTNEQKSFTVSGLTALQEVDIFENIKFNTAGGVPYLKINRVLNDEVSETIRDYVSYYIETGDKSVFNEGDTFKVKAYVSDSIRSAGMKPQGEPDEDGYYWKEFTVDSSMGRFITDKSDAADLEKFKDITDERIEKFKSDYTGRNYIGGLSMNGSIKSFEEFEHVKDYIVLLNGFEDGSIGSYDTKTNLFRIYKATANIEKDGKTSKKAFYTAFKFSGAYIDGAGEAQLESTFVTIYINTKLKELVADNIESVSGKMSELGSTSADGGDDDSKPEDDSSKEEDDKKDDSSEEDKKDESSEDESSKDDDDKKADESSKEDKDDKKADESSKEDKDDKKADESSKEDKKDKDESSKDEKKKDDSSKEDKKDKKDSSEKD